MIRPGPFGNGMPIYGRAHTADGDPLIAGEQA